MEIQASSLPPVPASKQTTAVVLGGGVVLVGLVGLLVGRGNKWAGAVGALIGAGAGWFARNPVANFIARRRFNADIDGFAAAHGAPSPKPKDDFSARQKTLEDALKATASFEWRLGINSDSKYDTAVTALKPTAGSVDLAAKHTWAWTQAVPAGSTWSDRLGQSNFAVVPFAADGKQFVSIATEHAASARADSPDQRASAFVRGFVFPFEEGKAGSEQNKTLADALRGLAKIVDPSVKGSGAIAVGARPRRKASDPALDAAMIHLAAAELEQGRSFCLRTLVLTKDSHPQATLSVNKFTSGGYAGGFLDSKEPHATLDSEPPDWRSFFPQPANPG